MRRRRRACASTITAVAISFAIVLAVPGVAAAHAVLIGASPGIGARVAAAPRVVVLRFDEPVRAGRRAVEVSDPSGRSVRVGTVRANGAAVDVPIAALAGRGGSTPDGVYTVTWQVVADDGDQVGGTFQFAVGSGDPNSSAQSGASGGRPGFRSMVYRTLLLFGVAICWLGVSLRRLGETFIGGRSVVVAGAATATAGALLLLVEEGSRLAGQPSATILVDVATLPDAIDAALRAAPGQAAVAAFVLFGAALISAIARPRRDAVALALVAAGVVAEMAGGHARTASPAVVSVAVWSLHTLAASAWLGSLAALAWVALRRNRFDPVDAATAARLYARGAIVSLLTIGVTGAYAYLREIDALGRLTTTLGGQLLVAKTGLLGLALLVAGASRVVALPRPRLGLLRRLTRGESLLVGLIVVLGGVMAEAAPPRSEALARRVDAAAPPPPDGPALRLGTLVGSNTVGLAAQADALTLTVLDATGAPLSDARITLSIATGSSVRSLKIRPCGPGCYTAATHLAPGISTVGVRILPPDGPPASGSFPIQFPLPPSALPLLVRAISRLERSPHVVIHESVSSDSTGPAFADTSTMTGKALVDSLAFAPQGAQDARLIGIETRDGRRLRIVAYYLPGAYLWHEVSIGDDGRVYHDRLVAPAHLVISDYEPAG